MCNFDKQALYGVLERHYDTGFSQTIADKVEELTMRDNDLEEINELSELAMEYRTKIRELTAAYRTVQGETLVRQVYAAHEKIFIRRQIADLWRLYRTLQADLHELTADFRENLGMASLFPTEKESRAAA